MSSADLVLRPASAVTIPIAAWIFLGLGGLDIAVRGTAGERLAYLPWLVVIAYALWLVLWAPRVVARRDDVVVRDVVLTRTLPYGAITDIRTGGVLRLDYTDAAGATRTVRPWNGPATQKLGRPDVARPSERLRRRRAQDLHQRVTPTAVQPPKPVDTLLERWRSHPSQGGVVTRRWHVAELIVLAALVAVAIVL